MVQFNKLFILLLVAFAAVSDAARDRILRMGMMKSSSGSKGKGKSEEPEPMPMVILGTPATLTCNVGSGCGAMSTCPMGYTPINMQFLRDGANSGGGEIGFKDTYPMGQMWVVNAQVVSEGGEGSWIGTATAICLLTMV